MEECFIFHNIIIYYCMFVPLRTTTSLHHQPNMTLDKGAEASDAEELDEYEEDDAGHSSGQKARDGRSKNRAKAKAKARGKAKAKGKSKAKATKKAAGKRKRRADSDEDDDDNQSNMDDDDEDEDCDDDEGSGNSM